MTPDMAEPWTALALFGASVVTLAPMSLCLGWSNAIVVGLAGPRPDPDLAALGLDRAPTSRVALRRAYRAAARAAHPDMPGGSAAAFMAVSEAFERLSPRVPTQSRTA